MGQALHRRHFAARRAFQRSVATHALKFTHRGDIGPVLELQRTVFQQKVATLENFDCSWLPFHEVHDLVELVPLLQAVHVFTLSAAYVANSQQLALATALGTRQTLQTVIINSVQLRPDAVQVLAAAPWLRTLWLIDCGLGDAGAGVVANALAQRPTLREVWLRFNAIGSRGATALATALESNDVLEELRLDFNKIRSRGAVALAEALRSNGTVRSLVIKYNPIGAQGVRALRSVAERIEMLVLLGHLRRDVAVVQDFTLNAAHVAKSQQLALATALATRPALQKVGIGSVQLSPDAVQVLAAAPWLRTLWLNDCGLGDAGAGAVANALVQHPTLREVQLQINGIGDRGATALASALESNDVLEELRLDFNKIRSRGAVALAEALRSNDTLRRLEIRFNPIGAQGVRALRSVAERIERIEMDHEGLEFNADGSWPGRASHEEALPDSLLLLRGGCNLSDKRGRRSAQTVERRLWRVAERSRVLGFGRHGAAAVGALAVARRIDEELRLRCLWISFLILALAIAQTIQMAWPPQGRSARTVERVSTASAERSRRGDPGGGESTRSAERVD
eukprot:g24224.t1